MAIVSVPINRSSSAVLVDWPRNFLAGLAYALNAFADARHI